MKCIVPDTGVLIDGRISDLLKRTTEKMKVVIHASSIAELEYQANTGKEVGFAGLAELKTLHSLKEAGKIELSFEGERPTSTEIERARFGEIDAKIRRLAKELKAVLLTSDLVQAQVAEAEGVKVEYTKPVVKEVAVLPFERYFTHKNTMSVHLKENNFPKAKVGLPGAFELLDLEKKETTRADLDLLAKEAVEYCKRAERSFIELDKKGATVMQIRDYRVTFTRPPFSEALEMTIVRPITKLAIEDYYLTPNLFNRLAKQAEGIVIAGPPGSGKSTFVTALAEYYARQKKIIKTLEQPRDLQVGKEITQYAPLEGSFAQAADVLLLVRPDYTIFDEVRRIDDFKTFTDLRLAGIGMVGVVHASKAIDAVQRFIGKIELGVIPQVIDTIIFIAKGRVAKVYETTFTVKVPFGMREKDLARPIIEVRDFETREPEFQIYKWGEETVVFPLPASQRANRFDGKGGKGDFGRENRASDSNDNRRNNDSGFDDSTPAFARDRRNKQRGFDREQKFDKHRGGRRFDAEISTKPTHDRREGAESLLSGSQTKSHSAPAAYSRHHEAPLSGSKPLTSRASAVLRPVSRHAPALSAPLPAAVPAFSTAPAGTTTQEASYSPIADEYRVRRILNKELHNYEMEFKDGRLLLFVPGSQYKTVMGSKGTRIADLEKRVGMKIDLKRA